VIWTMLRNGAGPECRRNRRGYAKADPLHPLRAQPFLRRRLSSFTSKLESAANATANCSRTPAVRTTKMERDIVAKAS
jgi:hypothetical protein